jgi:hypothetical protein
MVHLSNSSGLFKSEPATSPSTGTCPSEWRRWWRDQAQIDRTDWASLLEAAEAALARLRAYRLAEASS